MDQSGRNFITFAEESHPLLQEIPQEFRKIWFQQFEFQGERLCLGMERIFQNQDKNSSFADLLTFEIATVEELLEWEEDFGDTPFLASDPDYIYFDHSLAPNKAQFSIGRLHQWDFVPEIEIIMILSNDGIEIDFQDGGNTVFYHKKPS